MAGAQRGRRDQVVGPTLREPRQHVGRGRCDQQQVTPACQLDVQLARHLVVEHGGVGRLAGESGEGRGSYEFCAATAEHDLDLGAFLLERAQQKHGFVGGNAARHAQCDTLAAQAAAGVVAQRLAAAGVEATRTAGLRWSLVHRRDCASITRTE
jgi:hypothetical protein